MKRWRPWLVRAWRVALLLAAVFVIRDASTRREQVAAATWLTPARLRDFFPEAVSLGEANPVSGWREVRDADGQALGFATTTAPQSESIVGYSGPTLTLLAFDPRGALMGLRILNSHDTPDHLAEVVADRKFFTQFHGAKPGVAFAGEVHAVSGATLTSTAIAQGILAKLGQAAGTSLRFPEEINLPEVRRLEPAATSLRASETLAAGLDVLDAQDHCIGIAVRTSPVTDTLVGYKGPTDALMLLDPAGKTLSRIAIRKSFDTKRYVAYVTGDEYFLNLFNGMALEKLAALDFAQAKVEGVSGATETSWSVAEGLKRRSADLLAKRPAGWLRELRWRWRDTGHVVVIFTACLMAFTRLRGMAWLRHLHHILLVAYVGFFAGEMLSQSLFGGWAAHGVPYAGAPGLLLLAIVALAAPVFTSRQIYCHHICPHGALQQLIARRLPWQLRLPRWLDRSLGHLPMLLLAFVVLALVRGWPALNLNAVEPFDAYLFGVAGWGTIAVAIAGLIAALFTPLAYCKYGCPSGALFRLLRFTGDNDALSVRDYLAACLLGALWLL